MNRHRGRNFRATWAILLLAVLALPPAAGCDAGRSDYLAQARTILPEALRSDDTNVRALALEAYRDLRLTPPEETMAALVKDQETPLRFTAILVKAEMKEGGVPFFAKVVNEDPDKSVRLAGVYGLARRGDFSRVTLLRDGLNDESVAVRRNAAMILGLLGNDSAIDMLREHLADPDPGVRLNAAEAIARLGDNSSLKVIRALLNEKDIKESYYQVYVILALGRVGYPAEDIKILQTINSEGMRTNIAARLAALGARAMLGDYTRMNSLLDMIGKDSRGEARITNQDRAFALQLLARISYGPAWAEVGSWENDSDPLVRVSAAWAQLAFDLPRADQLKKKIDTPPSARLMSEQDVLRRPTRTPAAEPATPLGPLGPKTSAGPAGVRK